MVFASSDVGIETIAVLGFDATKLLYLLDDRYQKGMEEGMEKGRAEGMEEGMSQRSLEIARKMLAKGMARTARSSPRCKSPTSSTSSVSPNPVPPNLKMRQQKENKDINSILAKTSKKHFREKKRLFL